MRELLLSSGPRQSDASPISQTWMWRVSEAQGCLVCLCSTDRHSPAYLLSATFRVLSPTGGQAHPGLPRTFPILAPKVLCPVSPSILGKQEQVATLIPPPTMAAQSAKELRGGEEVLLVWAVEIREGILEEASTG